MKAIIALAALAATPVVAASTQTFSAAIQPGQVHEECTKMDKGEARRYEWKSDAAVDFNIHYHEGKEIFYPVKKDAVKKAAGTFRAKTAQEYCWMWTSKSPATIDGKVEK